MSASITESRLGLGHPARDERLAGRMARRRRMWDRVISLLCILATLIGLLFLASILVTLVWNGAAGFSLSVITTMTRPPGSHGGLLNAIVGSLIQTALGTVIGTPIGLLVGTYLAEYGKS